MQEGTDDHNTADPRTGKPFITSDTNELNHTQRLFYNSRFDAMQRSARRESAANVVTNRWTRLRHALQQCREETGVTEYLHNLHRTWMGDLSSKRVLDLGCFNGNALTNHMASSAEEYIGIDLSEKAIADLNEKLAGIPTARAIAGDFLQNSFETDSFDVVYAHSVLHHFKYLPPVLNEIKRVLKPGGRLITFDPLKTEPINFAVRAVYRPFQTDRQWEHPFSRKTLRVLAQYFDVRDVRGIQGLSKAGYFLMPIPGLRRLGAYLSARGFELDRRYARSMGGLTLLCWQITLLLINEP